MRRSALFALILVFSIPVSYSQGVKIGVNPGAPNASSVLDIESSNQGLLPPRMTSAQRDAIVSPAAGLRIFNSDTGCENFYSGTNWREICGTCIPQPSSSNAGVDQLNLSGTTATLAGNAPGSGSSGLWSIVSGSGGHFSGSPTSSSASPVFTGIGGGNYILRWTHSSACGSTQDDVQISFVIPFACGSSIADVDGNMYPTVLIGTQCWTALNLKTTKYRNASAVEYITDNTAWSANTTGAYSWQGNNIGNGAVYGALYNWAAVTNPSGLCPAGWHVPNDAEFDQLVALLGGENLAGGAMKSISGWQSPNTGATNSSGFTALPGGPRNSNGSFAGPGYDGYWWSTAENNASFAWMRTCNYIDTTLMRYSNHKGGGMSVRCIQD